jgi:hypothetical protein
MDLELKLNIIQHIIKHMLKHKPMQRYQTWNARKFGDRVSPLLDFRCFKKKNHLSSTELVAILESVVADAAFIVSRVVCINEDFKTPFPGMNLKVFTNDNQLCLKTQKQSLHQLTGSDSRTES